MYLKMNLILLGLRHPIIVLIYLLKYFDTLYVE